MPGRAFLLAALTCLALSWPASSAVVQQGSSARSGMALPPLSWTCPMHPDILEPKEGICSICKMNLVAVRLDSIWTCPVHSVIAEWQAGRCPIDRRDLVQMTVAVSWTCTGRGDVDQLTSGKCPDGTDMVAKYTPRPHGNHNPQHGGQFFMAADNWHHLEGTLPRAGVFRLYLYDDYSKPLPLNRSKLVTGRIVTKEVRDPDTQLTKEVSAFRLALTRDGRYLEAKVDSRALPAVMTAKVKFKSDGPEYRFDFTFSQFSKEPARPARAPQAAERPPSPPVMAPAPISEPPGTVVAPIPDTIEEMVAELGTRNRQVRELIDRGALASVWVPAFQAKELALAIDAHSAQLPVEKREAIEPAIRRLVRTAWLLDAFGDLGNRQQIVDAYVNFGSAVVEIESLLQVGR